MNQITASAITFKKAAAPEFRRYAEQVLRNAKALASKLADEGVALVTGGTDNHLMVVDCISSFGLDGREAERVLDAIGITTNKQIVPDDPNPPLRPSGIRLGTPACTTRGMDEADMGRLARWMIAALRTPEDASLLTKLRREVEQHCRQFPVPGVG